MSTNIERVTLASVIFAVLLAQVLLYPGIDTLVTALGATNPLAASTWFLAAEFVGFIAFAGVWGAASDVAGRRVPFVTAGAAGGAVGYAALATLPTVVPLPFAAVILVRVAQGAATIGAFSIAMTMLMDLPGGPGRNMGAAGIAIGVGIGLGAPIGGQLYEAGPFVPLYAAAVLLMGVAVLSRLLADRVPAGNRHSVRAVVAGLHRTPELSLPYVLGFVDRLTAGFFALVGTFYFRTAFGLGPAETGYMLALFFAPFALLQYPMGVLSDRIGRTVPIVVGSALYGVGVVAVGHAPTVELAGAAMVGVGVLGALMAPATMALVTDLAHTTQRGVAMAGYNVFGSAGFLAGIVVGGTVAGSYGYSTAFLVAGSLEVVLALGAVVAMRRFAIGRAGSVT